MLCQGSREAAYPCLAFRLVRRGSLITLVALRAGHGGIEHSEAIHIAHDQVDEQFMCTELVFVG